MTLFARVQLLDHLGQRGGRVHRGCGFVRQCGERWRGTGGREESKKERKRCKWWLIRKATVREKKQNQTNKQKRVIAIVPWSELWNGSENFVSVSAAIIYRLMPQRQQLLLWATLSSCSSLIPETPCPLAPPSCSWSNFRTIEFSGITLRFGFGFGDGTLATTIGQLSNVITYYSRVASKVRSDLSISRLFD
jgi:hypothetical protein